jgi:hypothetical protein
VRHALAVAELHTRLIEGDRERRYELLELSGEPSCWRQLDGLAAQRPWLKPDSYVRLGVGAYEDSYFLEVDRGTEGSQAIERQLAAYAAYHLSGQEQTERGVFPRVLWLALDKRRVEAIAEVVAGLSGSERGLFQVAPFGQAVGVISGSAPGPSTPNGLANSMTPMI